MIPGLIARIRKKARLPHRVVDRIAICEHGNLGDVVACLPMAGVLKAAFPGVKIYFVARSYAKPFIDCCLDVDGYVDSDAIIKNPASLTQYAFDTFLNPFPWLELGIAARNAKIPRRVVHLRRGRNIRQCNRFVLWGRSGDHIHIAQRHLRDLRALGIRAPRNCDDLPPFMRVTPVLEPNQAFAAPLCSTRINLILHPKSDGHGREWPIEHYLDVARGLPADRYNLLVTGRACEGEWIARHCPSLFDCANVTNMTGRLECAELISLISASDGLIASGTGPLHLAGVLGIHALGLFPVHRRIGAVCWGPIGVNAESLSAPVSCKSERCSAHFQGGPCDCIRMISPDRVIERVMKWRKVLRAESTLPFLNAPHNVFQNIPPIRDSFIPAQFEFPN